MNQDKEKTKKQLTIFLIVAYGVTFLMGLLIWYGSSHGIDVSVFPTAQMMYPAAGVMLAYLITNKTDEKLPKGFYTTFIILTVLLIGFSVASLIAPSRKNVGGFSLWMLIAQCILIIGCIAAWIVLLATKKEKRRAYGLGFVNWKSSAFCVVLFLALYTLRMLLSRAIAGELGLFTALFADSGTWINIAMLPVNFFLTFIIFFGEEYGWRYYLQPIMQKKFGLKAGVIILGVVWGLWHIPLDFWYYSTDTGLAMAVAQQITCISLGIFFAYAYMKTNNFWVPVILHYLNNNLIPIFSGNYSSSVLENQVVRWSNLPVMLLISLVFCVFLFAKPFREEKTFRSVTKYSQFNFS